MKNYLKYFLKDLDGLGYNPSDNGKVEDGNKLGNSFVSLSETIELFNRYVSVKSINLEVVPG